MTLRSSNAAMSMRKAILLGMLLLSLFAGGTLLVNIVGIRYGDDAAIGLAYLLAALAAGCYVWINRNA